MDYLNKIKPYYQYVTLYNSGQGTPNHEIMQKISGVYEELKKEESATMFGKSKIQTYPTDLGCRACVSEMFQQLENWHRIYTERKPKKKVIDFQERAIDYLKSKGFVETKEKDAYSITTPDENNYSLCPEKFYNDIISIEELDYFKLQLNEKLDALEWYNIDDYKNLIPFKGVPQKNPEIVDLEKLTWPQLKKYAAEKRVKAKKKADIIQELNSM